MTSIILENHGIGKLVAISYHNVAPIGQDAEYQLNALFESRYNFPISYARYHAEIEAAHTRAWPAFGMWLNEAPAMVWTPSRDAFRAAWPGPIPPISAPCRLALENGETFRIKIAIEHTSYFIVPTRSKSELQALARRYPLWQGDKAFVPVDILSMADGKARDEARRRTTQWNAKNCQKGAA